MASETPMMDDLENGPWPSFVKEIKRAADKKESAKDLLRQQEEAFSEKQGLWKHGGIVGVRGYGGGVIGRYHQRPEKYPNLQAFHCIINLHYDRLYCQEILSLLKRHRHQKGKGLGIYLPGTQPSYCYAPFQCVLHYDSN